MNAKNIPTTAAIASAFAAALAIVTAPAFAEPKPPQPTMDKCFGIATRATMTARPAPALLAPAPRLRIT